MAHQTTLSPLAPGTKVEVRCHFNCSWIQGFVVADSSFTDGELGYRVSRPGDLRPLAAVFPAEDVRAEDAGPRWAQPFGSR